ncbi:MAG: hypothetical protein SFU25_00435 [Candidatus Caenarcaniphilales bacterium]|nr:hypothetical protein [Candidatus Caenarcaniphilales bacterium]
MYKPSSLYIFSLIQRLDTAKLNRISSKVFENLIEATNSYETAMIDVHTLNGRTTLNPEERQELSQKKQLLERCKQSLRNSLNALNAEAGIGRIMGFGGLPWPKEIEAKYPMA